MALGLGQILGGAILGGGLLGGKDDDEQQGIMSGISNVSNSLFAGMSQEQVYRLGQGFNSMRLEPDESMHTSFENRITNLQDSDAKTKNRSATVTALLGMKSEQYPNGRTDLAEMVKTGVLPAAEAITMATKVEPLSAFAEKMAWLKNNPDATPEQKALAGITTAVETEFDKKFKLFSDTSKDSILTAEQRAIGMETLLGVGTTKDSFQKKVELYNEMKKKGELTPDMLELFGIPKVQQAEFEKKMNELELLAEQNGMKPTELMDRKIALVSNFTPDDGKTDSMKLMDYRAQQAGLEPGTEDYQNFFLNHGQGNTTIDIDLGADDAANAEYDKKLQAALVTQDIADIEAVRKAHTNIKKLDEVLGLVESGKANLGALQGVQQRMNELVAKFTNMKEATEKATNTQLLEALLGSDVFGMIAILGIGARGIDTPAERDFLIKVMTGQLEMTPEALKQMTYYRRKYSRRVIDEYNSRLDSGYYDDYKRSRKLERIEVAPLPVYQPPQVENTVSADRATELNNKYNLSGSQ
tara:strand:- start:1221 stop:2801 length:1581 start_codon:yes stop_codon:yes gene_type:complete